MCRTWITPVRLVDLVSTVWSTPTYEVRRTSVRRPLSTQTEVSLASTFLDARGKLKKKQKSKEQLPSGQQERDSAWHI